MRKHPDTKNIEKDLTRGCQRHYSCPPVAILNLVSACPCLKMNQKFLSQILILYALRTGNLILSGDALSWWPVFYRASVRKKRDAKENMGRRDFLTNQFFFMSVRNKPKKMVVFLREKTDRQLNRRNPRSLEFSR